MRSKFGKLSRVVSKVFAWAVDLLTVCVALVIVLVIVTGGGVVDVPPGIRVSVRSADNPLTFLAILLLVRYRLRDRAPWFGVSRWHANAVLSASSALVTRTHEWAARTSAGRGARLVAVWALFSLALKLLLAFTSPGFFSGDDVEIHEMSLGVLLHRAWPVWDVRSPVFPLGFIYPVQWLAFRIGVGDIGSLVNIGRALVAAVSTLAVWITWRIAARWWPREKGYAVLAAALLATAKLQVAFGSSELPRPVSTVLVLTAYVALQRTGLRRTITAGAVLGVAACLRFSEAVFLIPAVLQMTSERRARHAPILCVVAGATALGLIGLTDKWYWGEPFHSLRAIVDYTLVQRLSSRGYEPVWWYLTAVPYWTSIPALILAIIGWRAAPRAAGMWLVTPLILLSILPHKEARYLVPITPFLSLLCAAGIRRGVLLVRSGTAAPAAALAIVAGVCWGFVQDAAHYRLPRTNADVRLARREFRNQPPPRALVVEQAWRVGGRLYAGDVPVIDLDPTLMTEAGYLREKLLPEAWVFVDSRTLDRGVPAEELIGSGFREVARFPPTRYVLWRHTASQ